MMQKSRPKEQRHRTMGKGIILFALAALAYANTIPHDYALDDVYAITRNTYTKQGFDGIDDILKTHFFAGFLGEKEVALTGGRYRPLSLVTFAIEYAFFGENPHLSHFLNMLLYALMVLLAYRVLRNMFRTDEGKPWLDDALLVALALYALHPLHTEVVANIKGRDEILALGFALLAMQAAWKYTNKPGVVAMAWIMTAFFLALMSKENAAAFLLIIPLGLFWAGKKNIRQHGQIFFFLLIPLLVFVWIRYAVLGTLNPGLSQELMDNPFLEASLSQRLGTILLTFGNYYRLMVFPHPLTWDYYPYHIPLVSLSSWQSLVSLVITLGLLTLAVVGTRQRRLYAFGLWFFFISFFMVSNLLVTTGVFMAERFMFMPSLGLCLALAAGYSGVLKRLPEAGKKVWKGLLILVLVVFAVLTIQRNKVWKDNFTLYTTDVVTSAHSAKGNNIAGQFFAYEANQVGDTVLRREYQDKALFHLQRAIQIHPRYTDAWFHYGNAWYDFRGNLDSLLYCYDQVLRRWPQENNIWQNLNRLVKGRAEVEDRIRMRQMMLRMYPDHAESLAELGRLLASRQDFESALPMLQKAVVQGLQDPLAWETLAFIHYSQGRMEEALTAYRKAYALDPANPRFRQNLYALLFTMGRTAEAAAFAP